MLTYEARYPEALDRLTLALQLDPSSTANLSARALILGMAGHRDEAVKMLQDTGTKLPIASVRFDLKVLSLISPRNIPLYLIEELQLNALAHNDPGVRAYTEAQRAYLRGGETAMWRAVLDQLHFPAEDPTPVLEAYAALGDSDEVFKIIENSESRPVTLMSLEMDPLLTPLHKDPRFEQALRSAGLPLARH